MPDGVADDLHRPPLLQLFCDGLSENEAVLQACLSSMGVTSSPSTIVTLSLPSSSLSSSGLPPDHSDLLAYLTSPSARYSSSPLLTVAALRFVLYSLQTLFGPSATLVPPPQSRKVALRSVVSAISDELRKTLSSPDPMLPHSPSSRSLVLRSSEAALQCFLAVVESPDKLPPDLLCLSYKCACELLAGIISFEPLSCEDPTSVAARSLPRALRYAALALAEASVALSAPLPGSSPPSDTPLQQSFLNLSSYLSKVFLLTVLPLLPEPLAAESPAAGVLQSIARLRGGPSDTLKRQDMHAKLDAAWSAAIAEVSSIQRINELRDSLFCGSEAGEVGGKSVLDECGKVGVLHLVIPLVGRLSVLSKHIVAASLSFSLSPPVSLCLSLSLAALLSGVAAYPSIVSGSVPLFGSLLKTCAECLLSLSAWGSAPEHKAHCFLVSQAAEKLGACPIGKEILLALWSNYVSLSVESTPLLFNPVRPQLCDAETPDIVTSTHRRFVLLLAGLALDARTASPVFHQVTLGLERVLPAGGPDILHLLCAGVNGMQTNNCRRADIAKAIGRCYKVGAANNECLSGPQSANDSAALKAARQAVEELAVSLLRGDGASHALSGKTSTYLPPLQVFADLVYAGGDELEKVVITTDVIRRSCDAIRNLVGDDKTPAARHELDAHVRILLAARTHWTSELVVKALTYLSNVPQSSPSVIQVLALVHRLAPFLSPPAPSAAAAKVLRSVLSGPGALRLHNDFDQAAAIPWQVINPLLQALESAASSVSQGDAQELADSLPASLRPLFEQRLKRSAGGDDLDDAEATKKEGLAAEVRRKKWKSQEASGGERRTILKCVEYEAVKAGDAVVLLPKREGAVVTGKQLSDLLRMAAAASPGTVGTLRGDVEIFF